MADYVSTIENLDNLLKSLPQNTVNNFYTIKVTNIYSQDVEGDFNTPSYLSSIIQTNERYVFLDEDSSCYHSIQTMFNCFYNCLYLVGISELPSTLISMRRTFLGCVNFNCEIKIPTQVTDMENCFSECISFNSPIDIPTKVTDMSYCFRGCSNFNHPVTIPFRVTNAYGCFMHCGKLNSIITIQTDRADTDLGDLLYGCGAFNQPITIPERFYNISLMLDRCHSFDNVISIPCNSLDKVLKKLPNMTFGTKDYVRIRITSVTASSLTPEDYNGVMRSYCGNVIHTNVVKVKLEENQNDYISNITDMIGAFQNTKNLIGFSGFPEGVTNLSSTFYNCEDYNYETVIPNTVTNMEDCFGECVNLNSVIHISDNATTLTRCFSNCASLNKNIVIPISVSVMLRCFEYCTKLQEITFMSHSHFNNVGKTNAFVGTDLKRINILRQKEDTEYGGYHLKHINNDLSIDIYNKQGELIRNTTIPYSQNLTIVGKTNELVFGEEIPSEKIVQAIDARTPFSKTGTSGKYDITKKNFILWGADPNAFLTNLNFDTTVRDFIVPVGFIYTQYPLELPPWQLWTFTTQSNWENISNHFAGLFSRIEGGNSEQFEKILPCSTNGTTLTFETTEHGITNFSLLIDTTTWECRQVTAVNGASVTIAEAFTDSVNLRNVLIGEREQLPNVRGKFRAVGVAGTESGAFRYDSNYSAYSRGSGSDLNNKKMSLSLGQTNADGTTYISELQSVYKDGGIVRPNAYITRVWKRVN